MTRDQQITAIRAACIKANPDTGWSPLQYMLGGEVGRVARPIRLADVLLAITNLGRPLATRGRSLMIDALVYWDLMQDDLTQQSDECVAYLAHLLG